MRGLFGFTGGYIGVDIFFVISGYLITSIILDEIDRNRFSIVGFYERRARRILPALSVVLIITTAAAYILIPADLLKSYSQSLVSVATFSSNVFFYLTNDYFSTAADEKPLLHTWSLAVEEQYYLFFPVMVSALWFAGKARLTLFVVVLSIASLSLSQYLSIKQSVDANFYLIFSRAWELFVGSLIALLNLHSFPLAKWKREIAGVVGLLLIFCSTIFFDSHTPFPSLYTLIPVMGAAVVVAFSNGNTYVGRLLSGQLFVAIGLISYSLYLWHQPLFALLRLKTIGEPLPSMMLGAIVLTFILAYFSYHYIEKPFRARSVISRPSIFKYSALSILMFVSIGLCGHLGKGFDNRFASNVYTETIEFSPKRDECHTKGAAYLKPEQACRYFGNNISWASFGDSHTVEPAYALAKMLEQDGDGLLHLSFSGCPPAILVNMKEPGCSDWINESLAYLERSDSIKNVLVGFRYSAYLFGDQLDAYPALPNDDPIRLVSEDSRYLMTGDPRETFWQGFSAIIARLLASGKTVYVLYPIPELPVHISKAVSPFSVFSEDTMLDLDKSTTADYYFRRNRFIIDRLDSLPYGDGLYAIRPFDILCDSDYCPAVANGKALYFDDDHLSTAGAARLIANSVIGQQHEVARASAVTVNGGAPSAALSTDRL